MDSDLVQLHKLLAANGFAVVRQKKHAIYKNSHGRIWVTPVSPSDTHAYKNNLSQFKKFLAVGIVKQASRNLGITALERRRADNLLHPERIAPRRDPKPRRFSTKRLRLPAAAPAPPCTTQKTKKELYFDAYAFGSRIRKTLQGSLGEAWPIVMTSVVLAWKGKCIKECEAMRRAGREEYLIAEHANRQRAHAEQWFHAMMFARVRIISGVTRVLQKAVAQNWSSENEAARIDAEIQKVFQRYFPGRGGVGFQETSAWIMRYMPKFSNDDVPLPPGAIKITESEFSHGA